MPTALVGHTGFVGGNLARGHTFDHGYNSKNIGEIAGRAFELVVCAGAPAVKWKANQDPEADRAALDALWSNLSQVQAEQFVLISTVDVYANPVGVDEDSGTSPQTACAYGRHRYELEQRVAGHFPNSLVVRLPGLFGQGLKKNVIFDFLNDNNVDRIESRGVFQFYSLDHLWSDIGVALGAGLSLVNFATEPVSVREVAREAFGFDFTQQLEGQPARYDFRTRHAALYGGSGGYLCSRSQVLGELRDFVRQQMGEKKCA